MAGGDATIGTLGNVAGTIVSEGTLKVGVTSYGGSTFGNDLALVAGQGLIALAGIQQNTTASFGNLTMVAGANVAINFGNNTATFTGASSTGGYILAASNTVTGGGNLTAVAYNGSGGPSFLESPGTVSFLAPINTGSALSAHANGNVTIIAGATSGTALVVQSGITSSGLSTIGPAGTIELLAASPVIIGGTATIKNFAISPLPLYQVSNPTLTNGSINVTGDLIAVGMAGTSTAGAAGGSGGAGGNITIQAAGPISVTGNLLAFGGGGGGGGSISSGAGFVGGKGGSGGTILVQSTTGAMTISGDVNSSGGGGGGGGAGGSSAGVGGGGGSAGAITISAPQNGLTIGGQVYSVSGGDGGTGAVAGNNGGGGGGSFGGAGGGGAGLNNGGGGGGGYSNLAFFASGGGGGGSSVSTLAAGGGGGGYFSTGVNAGAGGSGGGTLDGLAGTATTGGTGGATSGGAFGGSNSTGGGGQGGQNLPVGNPGKAAGVSISATSGAIEMGGTTINLTSGLTTAVQGATVSLNTASLISSAYLADADYSSIVNTYAPNISGGSLTTAGNISATSSPVLFNEVVQSATIAPGTYNGAAQITITESGAPVTIVSSSNVTPAEYVALVQVATSNSQPLLITGTGQGKGIAASGGVFSLASINVPSSGGFTNLVIPSGVTLNATAPSISYSGDFTNDGTINYSSTVTKLTVGGTMTISGPVNFGAASPSITVGSDVNVNSQVTFNGVGTATVSSMTNINNQATITAVGNLIFSATNSVQIENASGVVAQGTLTLSSNSVMVSSGSEAQGSSVIINTSGPSAHVDNFGTIESGAGSKDSTSVTSSTALTVTGSGQWNNPTALSIVSAGTLDLSASSAPSSTNNLTLTATGGNLLLPTLLGNQIAVTTDSSGNGGTISITANSILTLGGTVLNLNADGTGTGYGGKISVTEANSGITIGGNANQLNFSAQGGSTSGNGGSVIVSNTGDVTVNSGNINLTTVSGNGGNISLTAGAGLNGIGTLTITTGALSADGVAGGSGGQITLSATTIANGNGSSALILSAAGDDTGSGGLVSYTSTGSSILNLNSSGTAQNGDVSIVVQSGANGGNGGQVIVSNGTGNINFTSVNAGPQVGSTDGDGGHLTLSTGGTIILPAGLLSMDGNGNGQGGLISLTGSAITVTGAAPIQLEADAFTGGSGSGGTIIVKSTAITPLTIGSANGNLTLSAAAGNGGSIADPTTGGTVSVSTGGNLIVNAAAIDVSSGAASGAGSGGSISLTAGTNGASVTGGTLVVIGALHADASGSAGSGGNITLQSNSKTAFAIDSAKTTNGTQSTLSVAGTGGQEDGSLSVTNLGAGGINDLEALSAVSQVTFSTARASAPFFGANGPITINNSLGGPGTAQITLVAAGTGKITEASKFVITADALDVSSKGPTVTLPSSTFTLPNVNVSSISALTGTKGTVSITNLTPNEIDITGGKAGTFTVKSNGNLVTVGGIAAGVVTLQNTLKTGGIVEIGSSVDASTGNLSLITVGSIFVDPAGSVSGVKAVALTATGVSSLIHIAGTINTSSTAGTVTLTAAASTRKGGSIIGEMSSDISANKSVTITATKDSAIVNTIGANTAPGTVAITALSDITTTGTVIAGTAITVKSTSTTNASTISIGGDMETTTVGKTATGTIAITVSGAAGQINDGAGDLGAGKSVTLTAAKGSILVDSIGAGVGSNLIPTTVSLTALINVQNNGEINATSAVTEKTTSTSAIVASNIEVEGSINAGTAGGKVGAVTLTNAGASTTSGIDATADISSSNTVTLTASKGLINLATIGSAQTTGVVKVTSAGALVESGSITAGTSIVLTTTSSGAKFGTPTGSITVNSLQTGTLTSGGSISVIAAGGKLEVDSTALISANSGKATTKALVTLENKLITGATTGTIVIDGGATIETGGAGGSNVNIVMGSVPGAPKLGVAPTIALYSVNGKTINPVTAPPFYFGTTATSTINVVNSGTPDQLLINSIGLATALPKVIFSTGTLLASAITVNAGPSSLQPTTITADPSLNMAAPAVHVDLISLSSPTVSQMAEVSSSTSPTIASLYYTSTPAASVQPVLNQLPLNMGAIYSAASSNNGVADTGTFTGTSTGTLTSTGTSTGSSSGAIQAVNASRTLYGSASQDVAPTQSIYIGSLTLPGSQIEAAVIGPASANCTAGPTAESLELGRVGNGESASMQLRKGNVIVAPTQDTTIDTGFATVKVSAGSIALIMATPTGTAVYNLDDGHTRSVVVSVVSAGERQLALAPGRHVLVTSHLVDSYDLVNPAQSFSYRNLSSRKIGGDLQAFTGEFSISSAISNVKQLRLMFSSPDAKVKRISGRMLKTAAILSQLSAGSYQQYIHPSITAVASR